MKTLTYTQAHITFNGRAILIPGDYTEEKVDHPIQEVKGTITLRARELPKRSRK